MPRTDTVKIQRIFTDTTVTPNTTTLGVEEKVTLAQFAADMGNGTVTAGTSTTVVTQTAPAAAPAAFADLTAAATAYNAMRTALIAAKVLV